MVCCRIQHDKLALLLLRLHERDVVCPQQLWAKQDVLVPYERATGLVQLWENAGRHTLELALVLGRHAVPDLGCSKVEEVYGQQVSVLFVPAEKRAPHAKVCHRRRHARNAGDVPVAEHVAKVTQVPPKRQLCVEEGHWRVRAVQRRLERDVAPERTLQQRLGVVALHLFYQRLAAHVLLSRNALKLLHRHLTLLFKDASEGALCPKRVLPDWGVDDDVLQGWKAASTRFPLGWRDDLEHGQVRVLCKDLCHKLLKRSLKLFPCRPQHGTPCGVRHCATGLPRALAAACPAQMQCRGRAAGARQAITQGSTDAWRAMVCGARCSWQALDGGTASCHRERPAT
mmetsp:Transcript_9097/g.27710  ORF Transcript_9097/g.27710 Transcript_9097/m.27710 type:complete len:342 (+) Transcript_9097:983-2008(+)